MFKYLPGQSPIIKRVCFSTLTSSFKDLVIMLTRVIFHPISQGTSACTCGIKPSFKRNRKQSRHKVTLLLNTYYLRYLLIYHTLTSTTKQQRHCKPHTFIIQGRNTKPHHSFSSPPNLYDMCEVKWPQVKLLPTHPEFCFVLPTTTTHHHNFYFLSSSPSKWGK